MSTYCIAAVGRTATTFLDDAILIEKYTQEFRGTSWIDYKQITTTGSISVHINANREGMGGANDHWIDYNVGWVDDKWHHIAATWSKSTGEVALYFDGQPATPYWVSNAGATEVNEPEKGGVSRRIATGAAATQRSPRGSLVLGSKQENMGGMFSPHYSLHGSMANVRVWDRVLSQQEVGNGMFTSDPPHKDGLKFSYSFDPGAVLVNPEQDTATIKDAFSPLGNDLYLGADAPQWVYSSVPLALPNGAPVPGAVPGSAGFALTLNDQQALILKGFKDFPAEELTVEFWMLSSDTCHRGVPFSYAAIGATYSKNDNAFLVRC